MTAIKEGKFNDVPANFLEAQYEQAARVELANRNEMKKRNEQAEKIKLEDPAEAAIIKLSTRGVDNPTRDQIVQTQVEEYGVPPALQSYLRKSEAKEVATRLANVSTVDEFEQVRAEFSAAYEKQGVPAEAFLRDVSRLGELPPAVALAFGADPELVSRDFVSAAIELTADPKLATKAKENIVLLSKTTPSEVSLAVQKAVAPAMDFTRVLYMSGASSRSITDYTATIADASTVMVDRQMQAGNVTLSSATGAVRKQMETLMAGKVIEIDGNHGFVLPEDVAAQIPPSSFVDIVPEVINKLDLMPLVGVPTAASNKAVYAQDSGWTMAGDNTLILRMAGQPVMRADGKPITITHGQIMRIAVENPYDMDADRIKRRLISEITK